MKTRRLSAALGVPKGWENAAEHPLTLATKLSFKANGGGVDRNGKKKPRKPWLDHDEAAAGEFYRKLFEMRGRSGVDSLELVGGGRSGLPFTQAQVNAIRIIQAIEAELQKLDTDKSNWVVMVRKFCGEGWSMAASVKAANYKNPRFTKHRIKLALNKLSVAISRTKIDFRVSE